MAKHILSSVVIAILAMSWITLLAQSNQNVMTNEDLVRMLKAGISDDTIVQAIQNAPTAFDTNVDALIALKSKGASEKILRAILSSRSKNVAAVGDKKPLATSVLRGIEVTEYGQKPGTGVRVVSVAVDTPAKRAGLQAGDVIEQIVIGGRPPHPLHNSAELHQFQSACFPDCLLQRRTGEFADFLHPVELIPGPPCGAITQTLVPVAETRFRTGVYDEGRPSLSSLDSVYIDRTSRQQYSTFGWAPPINAVWHELLTGCASSEQPPSTNLLHASILQGLLVRSIDIPPEAAMKGARPLGVVITQVLPDRAATLAAASIHIGDVIHAVIIGGEKDESEIRRPITPEDFYRFANLCVTDCLLRIFLAQPRASESPFRTLRIGLSGNNFRPLEGRGTQRIGSSIGPYDASYQDSITGIIYFSPWGLDSPAEGGLSKVEAPGLSDSSTPSGRSFGKYTLDEINAAISRGTDRPSQTQGLLLIDTVNQLGQAFGQLAAQQGKSTPGAQVPASGFQIMIFTPIAWISQQASESVQAGRNFSTANVTAEMVRPVLRIFAAPSTPPSAGVNLGHDVSPVKNVLLEDVSKKSEIRPISRRSFTHQGLQGLLVEFSMDDLAQIRAKDPEFYVEIVGTNGNIKDFKIKRKHFAELP